MQVLTINGGSSSIKWALFDDGNPLARSLTGRTTGIGSSRAQFLVRDHSSVIVDQASRASTQQAAVDELVDWLKGKLALERIQGVGHRVVHGGPRFLEAQRVSAEMLAELRRISPFDPEHLPAQIDLLESFGRLLSKAQHVACFDTTFHGDLPRVARLLPLPRRYEEQGVRRYGFHGLSYASLLESLAHTDAGAARGRVILAHLGNGTSLAAVHNGRSIDTTMGFTPCAGVPMSTRSGDLDPGLVSYLAHTEGMSADDFNRLVNKEAGLLGLSETSGDMRELEARRHSDVRAAEAIEVYCYHIKKCVGGYAAALGGLDALVFSGGIGENSPMVRARICEGLDCLGIALDADRNGKNAPLISKEGAVVAVRVIPTDEETIIARETLRIIRTNERH